MTDGLLGWYDGLRRALIETGVAAVAKVGHDLDVMHGRYAGDGMKMAHLSAFPALGA